MAKRSNRQHSARLDTSAMLTAPKPAIAQVHDTAMGCAHVVTLSLQAIRQTPQNMRPWLSCALDELCTDTPAEPAEPKGIC